MGDDLVLFSRDRCYGESSIESLRNNSVPQSFPQSVGHPRLLLSCALL